MNWSVQYIFNCFYRNIICYKTQIGRTLSCSALLSTWIRSVPPKNKWAEPRTTCSAAKQPGLMRRLLVAHFPRPDYIWTTFSHALPGVECIANRPERTITQMHAAQHAHAEGVRNTLAHVQRRRVKRCVVLVYGIQHQGLSDRAMNIVLMPIVTLF